MTFETAIVISVFILGAGIVAMIVVIAGRRAAANEEEMRRQSSMRGWTYERVREGRARVRRWRGATDGVAWIAESVAQLKGSHGKHASERRMVARWRSAASHGPAAPILCIALNTGAESATFAAAQGDGWLAQMAQKAIGFAFDKAVDTYFGLEIGGKVDAAALRRVEGTQIPGFVIMAADTEAASRLLFQGLSKALTDMPADARPWVLFWSGGVALARMEHIRAVDQIERLARAGVALTRVPTFGRPSPS
jgi:hypothetical protein